MPTAVPQRPSPEATAVSFSSFASPPSPASPVTRPPILLGRYSDVDVDTEKKLAERAIYGHTIEARPTVTSAATSTPVFKLHKSSTSDFRAQNVVQVGGDDATWQTTENVDDNDETKIEVVVTETGKKGEEGRCSRIFSG